MNDTAGFTDAAAEVGPGRMLAELRSERKLSVTDVAQRLKYGARQIEALEAEEFGKLPGGTFVRGMVRGYAKLLDIDPQPVLQALERRYVPGEITVDLRAKRIPFEGGRRGTRAYLILSLIVLMAVAVVVYEWHTDAFPWATVAIAPPPPKVEKRAAASRPTRAVEPAVAVAPAIESLQPQRPVGRIRLEFDSESWVEVTDGGGRTLMSQLNLPGTRRVVSGQPPLSLVIGNAAAVRLTYNDNPVNLKPYITIEVARLVLK
jgi:cytoskeleton protein RodZ